MKLKHMALAVILTAGLAVGGTAAVAAEEPTVVGSASVVESRDLRGAVPISSSREAGISPLARRPRTQSGNALVRVGGVLLLAAGSIGFAARRSAQAAGDGTR